jgi:hypothetical protein
MDPEAIVPLLRAQHGVAAVWQLLAAGVSVDAARHWTATRRRMHDGVHLDGYGPPTPTQRWWAAAVSAPTRRVSHRSAATAYGFDDWRGREVFVTGRGNGGPIRRDGLVVFRSLTIDRHATTLDGLPITTPARTLIDLCPIFDEKRLGRAVREALRLGCVTCAELQIALLTAPARKRPQRLVALTREYAPLPINRTRSDPEAYALALFAAAGVEPPRVNVRVNGEEADFWWPRHKLVLELDGRQFHQFPAEDARKAARWSAAGQTVEHFPSAAVYTRARDLLALVPA